MNFLKKATKAVIEKLVKGVVEDLAKIKSVNETVIVKMNAAIKVMRMMSMVEELKLFTIIVVAECGRLGVQAPAAVLECVAADTTPSPLSVHSLETKEVHSVPVTPTLVSKSEPTTAPARQLDRRSPEKERDVWISLLNKFLKGSRKFLDPIKTCRKTAQIFESGVEIAREHWETFFAAMTKADRSGRGFPIIDNRTNLSTVFAAAPIDLLDRYIFEDDGALVLLLASYSELGEGEEVSSWLTAKSHALVQAIDALDQDPDDPSKGRLNDEQFDRVVELLEVFQSAGASDKLIAEIKVITGDTATERVENGAARGVEGLVALRDQLPEGSGNKPEPAAKSNPNTKNTAAAFSEAANKAERVA